VTNRGLVFPASGQSASLPFSIRCNDSYGANTSDRPLAYLEANGTLTVGVYNRVFQTSDHACTLNTSSGLPDEPITSLVSALSAPQRMYVGTRTVQKQAGIFASDDYGRTFSQRFTSKVDEYYETIVVAPSDSLRLYALGLHFDRANQKVVFYASVSLDGGANWQDTVADAKITPLAVHPSKPDVVFAYRATDKYETTFDVMRSDDRGKNFKVVLPGVYLPTGFAVVGNSFYIGTSFHGGFYESHDDGEHFAQLLTDQIQRVTCLAEHAGKLWMCANIAPNLDGIWVLKSDASGVDKVMSFEAVQMPVTCSDTAARTTCEQPWHDFDLEVHPPDDAGVDASTALDAGVAERDADIVSGDTGETDTGGNAEAEPELDAGDDAGDGDEKPRLPPARHRRACSLGVSAHGDYAPLGLLLFGLLALSQRLFVRARTRAFRLARASRPASPV
jgi:hypothetical protein